MAMIPFSEASYCKVLVPRPTHKRGRQGVAHDREPVERAAFRGSDGLEPPKSVTVSRMRFLETPIFTEAIEELLDHDGYYALQSSLILRREAGVVSPQSGGLRKIR